MTRNGWVLDVEGVGGAPLFVAFCFPRSKYLTLEAALREVLQHYNISGDDADIRIDREFLVRDAGEVVARVRPGRGGSPRVTYARQHREGGAA